MKHRIFFRLLSAAVLSSAIVHGQADVKSKADSKLYVRFGAGYGFAHAGQTSILPTSTSGSLYFNGSSASASGVAGTSESISLKKGSFGTGGALALAGGYMLTRNIGVELGVEAVVLPKKYDFTDVQTGNTNATTKYTTYAQLPVYLMPAVMMTTGGNSLRLYGRVGLAVPVADKMKIKFSQTDDNGDDYAITYELTQRFSLGFQGGAGLSYPLGKNARFFAEVDGLFRSAYAKKLEVTAASQNGINVLPQLSTNNKVIEFDYDLANATGSTPNPSAPRKELTSSSPYSSIGGKLGVSFEF